jgi:hypothetical protein
MANKKRKKRTKNSGIVILIHVPNMIILQVIPPFLADLVTKKLGRQQGTLAWC